MTYPLCDVCGDAIEDNDPHYYHEPDCPRFSRRLPGDVVQSDQSASAEVDA